MFNLRILRIAIAVRSQTVLRGKSSVDVLFQARTFVSLPDFSKTVDIVISFPRQLNLEPQKVFQFLTVLQEVEKKTWSSSKFCNKPKLSLLLQHHFDDFISSIKTEYARAEKRRNRIINEVEPLLERAGCRLLSVFGLCHSAENKMEQYECRIHNLESQTV